jgi:hypothetical protein
VAAIGGDHRESARQRRRLTGRLGTQRQSDAAVQSTAALKQETPIPLIGQRQRESDPVRFSIRSGALIDYAVDAAERGNRDAHRSGKDGEIRSVPGAEAGIGSAFVIASGDAGKLKLEHVGAGSLPNANGAVMARRAQSGVIFLIVEPLYTRCCMQRQALALVLA